MKHLLKTTEFYKIDLIKIRYYPLEELKQQNLKDKIKYKKFQWLNEVEEYLIEKIRIGKNKSKEEKEFLKNWKTKLSQQLKEIETKYV